MRLPVIRDVAVLALLVAAPAPAADYPIPLPVEPIPAVETLPAGWPTSWMLVHDMNFTSLLDGRIVVVDTAGPTQNLKGVIPAGQFASFVASNTRPEVYVAETYYSRRTRGERTDVLTIHDRATLSPLAEIPLPGGKRGQFVSTRNSLQLINADKWALVMNFTPASSVTVVDLVSRQVLGDIDLPGCSMVYPFGPRGFATLCADGTMTAINLGADGKLATTKTGKPFNMIDNDPMFMMPAMVGNTAWFVTFLGNIRGVDMTGPVVAEKPPFALGTAENPTPQWRPGGWQVITADSAGRLYVLMSPNGKEGSHKDGGSEVWVIDPVSKKRLQRIKLMSPGLSIEATQEVQPALVVVRPDGVLDVYDVTTGTLRRSLGGGIAISPFTLAAVH
nr:amine dehydrogenase large subunit [Polymorphobacter sp.]